MASKQNPLGENCIKQQQNNFGVCQSTSREFDMQRQHRKHHFIFTFFCCKILLSCIKPIFPSTDVAAAFQNGAFFCQRHECRTGKGSGSPRGKGAGSLARGKEQGRIREPPQGKGSREGIREPQGRDQGVQEGIRGPRQYLVDAPRPIHCSGQGQQGPALQQDAAHTPLAAGDQHLSIGQTGLENHLGIFKGKINLKKIK